MNLRRYSLIIVSLAGLVLVSGLAGGLLGHRVARCRFEARNNLENWNEHVAQEFERVVKPTPEQATKIQAHLDRAIHDLTIIRSQTIVLTTNVIWRLVADVDQELTPDQRKAFEVMKPKPADVSIDMLKVGPSTKQK
jgi:hypothetical protein